MCGNIQEFLNLKNCTNLCFCWLIFQVTCPILTEMGFRYDGWPMFSKLVIGFRFPSCLAADIAHEQTECNTRKPAIEW